MQYTTYFEDEKTANSRLNLLLKYKSRCFQLIITDDNDESYIPNLDVEYVLCDCNNGENFTLGKTWKKYFEDYDNKPVLFINTSKMFMQFKEKGIQRNINKNGAALWAQYMYYHYRDKMWKQQKTKFLFVVKESDLTEMLQYVNAGFGIELIPIYIKKQKETQLVRKLELTVSKENK